MRRLTHVRMLLAAVLVLVVAGMLSFSSASTLGGLRPGALAGGTAQTRAITGVTLDWNLDATGLAATYASTLRITPDAGETFTDGDTVSATIDAGPGGTCTAGATATAGQSVDLAFGDCRLVLWELEHVALTITDPAGSTMFDGDLGGITGTLSAFDGDVIDPDNSVSVGFESSPHNGQEVFENVYVDVRDASLDDLVGLRALALLRDTDATPPVLLAYAGTIGTAESNDGVWAEVDPEGNGVDMFPTVTIDIRALAAEDDWPEVNTIKQYEIVILKPQHLTRATNSYAAQAISGSVTGGGGAAPVTSGTQPVGLDTRLTYSEPGGPVRLSNPLRLDFCYNFRVSNTSDEPVAWEVTFDTTKAPLWGLNPTIINSTGTGVLTSIWNTQTGDYDPATGLWTLIGVDWNRTLQPGMYTEVGYCAVANIPAVDPTTYDAPVVSIDPASNAYNVILRVKVTSSSEYLVPWEAEIDLADYVCAATLPATLTPENATLTRIDGTRYLLRGVTTSATRFVSAEQSRDFVFARFNPNGQPYQPGMCL